MLFVWCCLPVFVFLFTARGILYERIALEAACTLIGTGRTWDHSALQWAPQGGTGQCSGCTGGPRPEAVGALGMRMQCAGRIGATVRCGGRGLGPRCTAPGALWATVHCSGRSRGLWAMQGAQRWAAVKGSEHTGGARHWPLPGSECDSMRVLSAAVQCKLTVRCDAVGILGAWVACPGCTWGRSAVHWVQQGECHVLGVFGGLLRVVEDWEGCAGRGCGGWVRVLRECGRLQTVTEGCRGVARHRHGYSEWRGSGRDVEGRGESGRIRKSCEGWVEEDERRVGMTRERCRLRAGRLALWRTVWGCEKFYWWLGMVALGCKWC